MGVKERIDIDKLIRKMINGESGTWDLVYLYRTFTVEIHEMRSGWAITINDAITIYTYLLEEEIDLSYMIKSILKALIKRHE